jgi:hypothetical protein
MVSAAKPSEEDLSLQLQKTADGFSVIWCKKTVSKRPPAFGETIAKVWKEVSPEAKVEKKKCHFYRLLQLVSGLEEAQLSKNLTEEDSRTLESAKKTTIVTTLQMFSDKQGKVDFTKIQENIESRVTAINSKNATVKVAEARRLSQLASLLYDAIHSGAFFGDREQEEQAFVTAQLAIAQAGMILSSVNESQIPKSIPQELCRVKTKVHIELIFRDVGCKAQIPTAKKMVQTVAEVVTSLKKENPSFSDVIDTTVEHYKVSQEAYLLLGKKAHASISGKIERSEILTEEEWKTLVEKEIKACVEMCPCTIDEKRLKKIVLEEFIKTNFGAVKKACASVPPNDDWFLAMVEAHHVHAAFLLDPKKQTDIERAYGDIYRKMSDALFKGGAFTTTIPRQNQIVEAHLEKPPADLESWAGASASKAIRDTFGRMASIMVGGMLVPCHLVEDQSDPGRTRNAYEFSKAIVEEVKRKFREKTGSEHDDAEIQPLVNEIMMRCCGDASLNFIFSPMSLMIRDVAIQEVDLSTLRPGFTQLRFSVDESGSLVAEKVYVVQRKSLETGQTEYAEFTSKIVLKPEEKNAQKWTETIHTQPYGVALAKEVEDEAVKTGVDINIVFEGRKKALEGQVQDPVDRMAVIADMQKYLKDKKLLPKLLTE